MRQPSCLLVLLAVGCRDGLTELALKQFIILLAEVPLHGDCVTGLPAPEK